MTTWLDTLSDQVRAQDLAKRSAVFAVLVPVMLLIFAVVLGEGGLGAYAVPLAIATVGGIAIHLLCRWLEGRRPTG